MNKKFLKLALIAIVACNCGGRTRKALAEDYAVQDVAVAADNQGDALFAGESVSLKGGDEEAPEANSDAQETESESVIIAS